MVFSAYATYVPESKVGKAMVGLKMYTKKSDCEAHYAEDCLDITPTANKIYSKIVEEQILEMPAVEGKCIINDYILKDLETCRKVIPKHIVEDEVLKAQYDAEKAIKDQEKADKKAEEASLLEKLKTEDLKLDEINKLLRSIHGLHL